MTPRRGWLAVWLGCRTDRTAPPPTALRCMHALASCSKTFWLIIGYFTYYAIGTNNQVSVRTCVRGAKVSAAARTAVPLTPSYRTRQPANQKHVGGPAGCAQESFAWWLIRCLVLTNARLL